VPFEVGNDPQPARCWDEHARRCPPPLACRVKLRGCLEYVLTAWPRNNAPSQRCGDLSVKILEIEAPESLLDVVIPTADIRGTLFRDCIASLQGATSSPCRIVAVESSGTAFNFSRSINAGLSKSTQDVLILNDDTRLARGSIDALLQARGKFGEGAYQCYVHTFDGRPRNIGWSYDRSAFGPIKHALQLRAPLSAPIATIRYLATGTFYRFRLHRTPVDGFDGFSFDAAMVTRETIRRVGVLDEDFPLGWDDVDYSLRCHELGVGYYAVPTAIVYHTVNGTRRQGDPREEISRRSLARKWPLDRLLRTLEKGPFGKVIRR